MSASIEKPNMKVQVFLDQMSTDFLYTRRMELKDWIKDRRKKLGLTQEQLAEHFERSKATISAWENGGYEPTFEQIVWLYRATGKELPPPGLETVAAPPSSAQQDILHTFVISSALKNLEKIAAKNLSEVKSLLYLTEQLTTKEGDATEEKLLDLVHKNAARAREQLDRLADLSRSEEDAREEQSGSTKKSNTN